MGARLTLVVPAMIDDPERVSGGNVYDRRLSVELGAAGRPVRLVRVGGEERSVAVPGGSHAPALARALAGLPDRSTALIDGLLVAREPRAVLAHRARLELAILVHMVPPVLSADELDALRSAGLLVATSEWTRSALAARGVEPSRIAVARPGIDPAPLAAHSRSGGRLLCVAAVAPHKGQDLLVGALAGIADLDGWSCVIAGSPTAAPGFAARLEAGIADAGLDGRIAFAGALAGDRLEAAYARSDLLVHPSRGESYGMVVAEALARGIPVIAARVGGIAEAAAPRDAALFVPPEDAAALGRMLRRWLTERGLRVAMRRAAADARKAGRSWAETAAVVSRALDDRALALQTAGAG